jgi:hypothetical protein
LTASVWAEVNCSVTFFATLTSGSLAGGLDAGLPIGIGLDGSDPLELLLETLLDLRLLSPALTGVPGAAATAEFSLC